MIVSEAPGPSFIPAAYRPMRETLEALRLFQDVESPEPLPVRGLFTGGPSGTRTLDPLIKSQML